MKDELYVLASALDSGDITFKKAKEEAKLLGFNKKFKSKKALINEMLSTDISKIKDSNME